MWQLVKGFISLIIGLILISNQTHGLDWKFAVTTPTDIRFFDANWTYTNHRISNDIHLRDVCVFTYDTISNTLYYANNNVTLNQGQIYELKNFDNETHPQAPKLVIALDTIITGLVFDSISNNLYWSNGSSILLFNINTNKSETLLNKNGTFPTDITLDICKRQLYYINQHDTSTSIEQINLDTKKINVIADGLSRTRSITVDYYSNKLYWMDNMGTTNVRIEEANFNGTQRRVLLKRQSDNPIHLITDHDNIYYSSKTYKQVIRIGKVDSRRTMINYHDFGPAGPIDILMKHTSDEFKHYSCKDIIDKMNSSNFIRRDIGQPIPICKASENLNNEIVECKTDLCSNFCLNSGKCTLDDEQIAKCDCPPGFSGLRCELNKCQNFCMNDMKCNINNNGDPVCLCEKNKFSGHRCEEDVTVDLCKNRCLNDGTCTINNGLPVCHCSSLYTGDRCQHNVCQESYCLNNGLCVVEEDKPVCICTLEYKGSRCEIVNQNTTNYDNYCLNGGVLLLKDGMATCTCPDTVTGARCQETLCKNYCLNDGVCNLIDGKPICECGDGVRGDRCQVEFTFNEIYNKSCNGDIEISNLYKIDVTEACLILPPNQKDCSCMPSSIIVVTIGVVLALVLILVIVVILRRVYKPLRPKVKKTYVVRKNFTPLTSRPGGGGTTEQCEITIEDCCNMNICETPCFDPKILQNCDSSNESPVGKKSEKKRKEDKRKLLDVDFSNGGELY